MQSKRILAIESSCDETAVAIVEGYGERVNVVASLVRSQIDIHAEYGGVVPEIAAREHVEIMPALLRRVFAEGSIDPETGRGIDAIAVTCGPGLAPALRVGIETAKALSWVWQKPLVPVCHLEGHIYASWLSLERGVLDDRRALPKFPLLGLIVSGGHTEFVLMRGHGDFVRLGETLDDAVGEAFDKVAKMLGLAYPGGPKVAALAEHGRRDAFTFPRSMCDRDNALMSFSGLKTAVLYTLRDAGAEALRDPLFVQDICASFEQTIIDILLCKTEQALRLSGPVYGMVLAGGVAANVALRAQLHDFCVDKDMPLFVPPFAYALDNAAMIGVAGYFRFLRGDIADFRAVVADPNLDIA
jgi:N6-L-threonylcarbamoyladenine synthase